MRVKICGITSDRDAEMCEDAGADALGFVHVEGRRRSLALPIINEMCGSLGPMTTTVLVCAPSSIFEAADLYDRSGVNVLQLHSLEPGQVSSLRDQGIPVIRAVRPDREEAMRFADRVHALLFERGTPGTGSAYDYSKVPLDCHPRSIIAGGLNPDNIGAAISLRPYAIDVSSGVEGPDGRKDPELVSKFIRRCNGGI